ncbi:tail fiber assembly protein [Pantoea ananatis]|uniref:tail fiber assembly protein n=1 Tax=Pantoea ananas TaxID=553 RepID=UPI001B309199|nr:tail fiber assembly protein [Pantoea ananatis]
MSGYALIKDGYVVNIVVWDGQGDASAIFEGFNVIEVNEKFTARIGDAYIDGNLIPYPSDGYEYIFDKKTLSWAITDEGSKKKNDAQIEDAASKKSGLLSEAQQNISLWQTELLLGMISDDDKASLTNWVVYIKALKAVDTSKAPSIEWPSRPS